jgi:phage recombination protein Bet
MEAHPFGEVVPGEAVASHGPYENIAGGQPRARFVRRSDGKPVRVDDIQKKEQTMSTALAERPATLPKDQLELVRRTVANGATNDELALFLYDCDRRGIHPLDKLLHFTKRGGKYTPVTSIDFMRAQAAMSGEMAGSEDATFTEDGGKLVSASVTVYRMTAGQRFPYTATARWAEYCPDNAPMWKRMPHTMLGKCAEALALRKAFPQQLAGLYSREEMDQADGPIMAVVQPAPAQAAHRRVDDPSVADSDVRRSGAEVLGDAALSPGAKSDEGPDLGVDMPAGARRILKVGPGVAGAKAEITFNAPVGDSGKASLLTFSVRIAELAKEFAEKGTPCFPGLKQSASGNWRVEDIAPVPKDYDPPAGKPQPAPMLTDSEIPF